MRVRPSRKPDSRRRGAKRRSGEPRPARRPDPDPATAPTARALEPERRLRAAGGPQDRAQYTCSCGYVFEAAVSAGVACPHCHGTQAW